MWAYVELAWVESEGPRGVSKLPTPSFTIRGLSASSPGLVGIHRSCGRELSSLFSFDSRFVVLFLSYGACFCRETWNRRLPWSGKPGIDEGRWCEVAGG